MGPRSQEALDKSALAEIHKRPQDYPAGAYTEISFKMGSSTANNPAYYYCANHSGMGSAAIVGTPSSTTFVPQYRCRYGFQGLTRVRTNV